MFDLREAFKALVAFVALDIAILIVIGVTLARAEDGIASVYSARDKDQPGTRTASGHPLNDGELTAAHRSLPFGTHVRVTNRQNGRSVILMITDRGPFAKGRVLDVTRAAAAVLGFCCLAPVTVERQ